MKQKIETILDILNLMINFAFFMFLNYINFSETKSIFGYIISFLLCLVIFIIGFAFTKIGYHFLFHEK